MIILNMKILSKIKFIIKIHPLKLGLSIQLWGVYHFHHILGCFNKLNIVSAKQLLFKYELF